MGNDIGNGPAVIDRDLLGLDAGGGDGDHSLVALVELDEEHDVAVAEVVVRGGFAVVDFDGATVDAFAAGAEKGLDAGSGGFVEVEFTSGFSGDGKLHRDHLILLQDFKIETMAGAELHQPHRYIKHCLGLSDDMLRVERVMAGFRHIVLVSTLFEIVLAKSPVEVLDDAGHGIRREHVGGKATAHTGSASGNLSLVIIIQATDPALKLLSIIGVEAVQTSLGKPHTGLNDELGVDSILQDVLNDFAPSLHAVDKEQHIVGLCDLLVNNLDRERHGLEAAFRFDQVLRCDSLVDSDVLLVKRLVGEVVKLDDIEVEELHRTETIGALSSAKPGLGKEECGMASGGATSDD